MICNSLLPQFTNPAYMPSQLVFSSHPSPIHSLIFSSPCFFRNNHNKTQQGKLLLHATTLSFSVRNSSESTLSIANATDRICPNGVSIDRPIKEEPHSMDFDRRNTRLQVHNFVDRIRALPTSERIQIIHVFERERAFQNLSVFNDVLLALFIADEPDLALKLYCDISSYGMVPDSWTFSIIIKCHCKKNDPSEAKRVLEHMVEIGFQPSVVTFTILINSFCRRGKLQKAVEILEFMGRIGCKGNVQTYNCLLKGLCYVGRVEDAYEFLMKIKKSSVKPDLYSYTAVMDGFCKVGRSDEAMELLVEALEMGMTPNVVTFNTLFNGYCKEGRPLEGIHLLKNMKERNCMPDYISYSTLLNGLLKWGKIHSALRIYREMVEAGFKVEERMMNTMLRGLCRRSWKEEGLLKNAHEVFEKMINAGCAIYPNTYGLVIQTLCVAKEVDKALMYLNEMVGFGYFPPRMITFNSVIRALCSEGRVDEALSILVLMCEGRRIPSRICYNLLIDEFNQQGRWLSACTVYGAALKRGVIPHKRPGKYSSRKNAIVG